MIGAPECLGHEEQEVGIGTGMAVSTEADLPVIDSAGGPDMLLVAGSRLAWNSCPGRFSQPKVRDGPSRGYDHGRGLSPPSPACDRVMAATRALGWRWLTKRRK
jgi:hypothetical protein